jgi:hypothetical protein
MKAYVTNSSSLLGESLIGALRWEGHRIAPSMPEADVVFDTTHGVIYRKDRALARFIYGEMLGPGASEGSSVGDWLNAYVHRGHAAHQPGGACITDARDVALAMIAAAERGLSGEFDVVGPFVTFDELGEMIAGMAPSRTSVALPELGLSFRPVEETILDTLAWKRSRGRAMVA